MTLVAQLLRELLFPPATELVDECSSVKLESGAGLLPAHTCSKRARDNDELDEVGVEPAAAAGSNDPQPRCSKRRKKQQQNKCLVTSTPDFDGYQWRKYGQKQIEGAMYPRSYYRCTWSAEQGCPAKRTVQRNDDDIMISCNGVGVGSSPPNCKYTVVYVAEHTCTANDSMEAAPVILETTAVYPTTNVDNRPADADDSENNVAGPAAAFLAPPEARHDAAAAAAASSPATTVIVTESPATSDDVTWSSASEHVDDYDSSSWMFDDSWAPSTTHHPPVESSSSLVQQDMDDFTGPIRSPVHTAAGGCWTMDPYHLLLVNEPITTHFSFSAAGFSF